MPCRWHRLLGTGILLAVSALALAGCGRNFPQRPLPPPPASSVEPVYPCELLTTSQMEPLHLIGQFGQSEPDPGSLAGVSCMWATGATQQDEVYYARLLSPSLTSGRPVPPVGGLPTTDATPASTNANLHCVLDIRLTSTTTLWAEFANIFGDIPNINHQTACDKARVVATDMVQTFQARVQQSPAR